MCQFAHRQNTGWKFPTQKACVRAHVLLGKGVFIDQPEVGAFSIAGFEDPIEAVLMILRRHPMRRNQIFKTLNMFPSEALDLALIELETSGKLRRIFYREDIFYISG